MTPQERLRLIEDIKKDSISGWPMTWHHQLGVTNTNWLIARIKQLEGLNEMLLAGFGGMFGCACCKTYEEEAIEKTPLWIEEVMKKDPLE